MWRFRLERLGLRRLERPRLCPPEICSKCCQDIFFQTHPQVKELNLINSDNDGESDFYQMDKFSTHEIGLSSRMLQKGSSHTR